MTTESLKVITGLENVIEIANRKAAVVRDTDIVLISTCGTYAYLGGRCGINGTDLVFQTDSDVCVFETEQAAYNTVGNKSYSTTKGYVEFTTKNAKEYFYSVAIHAQETIDFINSAHQQNNG